jgi:hypothetical protein
MNKNEKQMVSGYRSLEPNKLPLKIVLDVIADFMELDAEHCYIFNQSWIIPEDGKICVAGSMSGSKITANNQSHEKIDDTFMENINLREIQFIDINVFGRNIDVLTRQNEVIIALRTDKAQNTFEENGMFVEDMPTKAVNLDEGYWNRQDDRVLYRYLMSFNVSYGRSVALESEEFKKDDFKTKEVDH